MPIIYLSPSTQENNFYVSGGSEEYWMNRLADAMVPYLNASGIQYVRNTPEMTAAFVSLAYNIGPSAFKKSTVVRRFRARDYAGACAAMEMWNKAGGRVLPGLVTRRADERALCEQGIPAMLAAEVKL